jgi:hypothetical protein
MKNTLFVAALALTAAPAYASTLLGEVRIGNSSNEYRADYTAALTKSINYGVEFTTAQEKNQGDVNSGLAARLETTVFGLKTSAEVGSTVARGNNAGFWGVGAEYTHPLVGPVSGVIGYRHREAFAHSDRFKEDRANVGLTVNLGKGTLVGAQYYHTRGNSSVGMQLIHKF